jgi:anti-sigma regulatory factor (Ser/Thr protein kinase)
MPSVARTLDETYQASPLSVADGRARLADFAARAGATPSQVDAVRLAASEALTNSVLHAYRGGPGLIHVNAAVAADELWILISDDGCGLRASADRPGLGLGLGLISEVSDDFAVLSRANGGTEVWIRFNLATDEAPVEKPGPPEPAGVESMRRTGVRPMSVA